VIILFSLINIIQAVGIELFFPFFPIFVMARFPVDVAFTALLYAVGFGLASIVVQVQGGKWARAYDRRKIMLITFALSSPFYGLFALSQNYLELFVFMFLSNAVLNVSWPAFQALMMDLTPSEKWGLMNGISATTFWIGLMIGSAAGGILWDAFNMFVPFYASAFAILLSAVPVLFLKETRGHKT